MSKEYQYILTQDTDAMMNIIDNDKPLPEGASLWYLNKLVEILTQAYIAETEIIIKSFTESEIDEDLEKTTKLALDQYPNSTVLCLDRSLLGQLESDSPERFKRLSITRSYAGQKVPRIGEPTLDSQFEKIVSENNGNSIILVDDGIFTGGTVLEAINKLEESGLNRKNIKKIIGFIGNGQESNLEGIPLEIINPISNLFEWIDIRDFAPWGGKLLRTESDNNIGWSIPYLYPWSDGKAASLDKLPFFFSTSFEMIESYKRLITIWQETYQRELTFRDFIASKLPLPTTPDGNFQPSPDENIVEYLNRAQQEIIRESNRDIAIFDMDGTLYRLVGQNNNEFSGSLLEANVKSKVVEFIQMIESCNPVQAEKIFSIALQDKVGASQYLARRYDISREEYFNYVWNIDPQGLITDFEDVFGTIQTLVQSGTKCILLTGAPKIWQENVFRYLGIDNLFESIYTAEDFNSKEEIFNIIAGRYQVAKCISIGDQYSTDIKPADNLGFKTLTVQQPSDLTLISEIIK